MNSLKLTDRSIVADRSVVFFQLSGHLSGKERVIPQKLAKKDFLMPVPLTEGKAFHVPCVLGISVSGITFARGAAVLVATPNFNGIARANQADNRIEAREVVGPSPVGHPIQFERIYHAYPGGIALR